MLKRLLAGVVILGLLAGAAAGDTIVIGGEVHEHVSIHPSSTRYYIKFADGKTASVLKSEVQPWEIAFGDASLPPAPKAAKTEPEPAPTPESTPESTPAAEPAPAVAAAPAPKPEPKPVPVPAPASAPEPSVEPVAATNIQEVPVAEPLPAPESPAPEPARETLASVVPPGTTPERPEAPAPAEILPPQPEVPPLPKAPPVPALREAKGPLEAGAHRMLVPGTGAAAAALEINALVLRCRDISIAFCAVDAAAVDEALSEGVARRLAAAGSKMTRDSLLVGATGVHTGRYAGMVQGPAAEAALGAYRPGAVDEAADHITLAIAEAERSLAPASLRVAEAEAPQYHHVREAGSMTADSTLSVLSLRDAAGAPLACLLNYAICPPAASGSAASAERGVPGALAASLRASVGAEVPVLFFNGAAGDIEPRPPAGDTLAEQEAAIGEALARAALATIDEAPERRELTLACRAREALLPPSLLGELLPDTCLLHEVRIDDAVLLSAPGIPAAQMGQLLRVKAMSQDLGTVFLLALTDGYFGLQPTIEEYFAVTPAACFDFHGPLLVRWFSDNYLDPNPSGTEPFWLDVRALFPYAAGFRQAQARGARERAAIIAQWQESASIVATVSAAIVEQAGDELAPLAAALAAGGADAAALRTQLAAIRLRERYADFTAEQRAILMGIADGAGMPFDAVMVMQLMARPEKLPEAVRALLEKEEKPGIDFLAG